MSRAFLMSLRVVLGVAECDFFLPHQTREGVGPSRGRHRRTQWRCGEGGVYRRHDTEWFKVAGSWQTGVTAVVLSFAECSGGWCEGCVCDDREWLRVGANCRWEVSLPLPGLCMQWLPLEAGFADACGPAREQGRCQDSRQEPQSATPSSPTPHPWASSIKADQRAAGGGAG